MSRRLLDNVVFKYIDAKLMVDGGITTKDVFRLLGLSRQKVSALFRDYLNANPDSMVHDTGKRKYVPTATFTPAFLGETSPADYIASLVVVFGSQEGESSALSLAALVVEWWQEAQYWDDGERNVFDTTPEFVKRAIELSIIEKLFVNHDVSNER